MKAGDTLFVPVAVPHQFQVQPGGHMVYTVVEGRAGQVAQRRAYLTLSSPSVSSMKVPHGSVR